MSLVDRLLAQNRAWAERMKQSDALYFERLAGLQEPQYLWIGCSDSRVPANQVVGLEPGEVFVHRNVGNVVANSDLNCLSVMQYAVEALEVKHIIVCGHYGCGAVTTAMSEREHGLIDNWLRGIRDLYEEHRTEIDAISDGDSRREILCELNVARQVRNVCNSTIVRGAWRRGVDLSVHGWIYSIHDGLIRDLKISVRGPNEIATISTRSEEWLQSSID